MACPSCLLVWKQFLACCSLQLATTAGTVCTISFSVCVGESSSINLQFSVPWILILTFVTFVCTRSTATVVLSTACAHTYSSKGTASHSTEGLCLYAQLIRLKQVSCAPHVVSRAKQNITSSLRQVLVHERAMCNEQIWSIQYDRRSVLASLYCNSDLGELKNPFHGRA